MNARPKKTRSPRPLKIEIGERIEGDDPRPPMRWKPWAWAALAALLLTGAGAWLALSRDTRYPPPDTLAEAAPPAAEEPTAPDDPPAEPDLTDLLGIPPIIDDQSPITSPPPPAPGALRILVRAPDHATAFLATTAKRLRLSTNAWESVAAFPHLVADLPPGPLEVTLDATGFIVDAPSRRVPVPDTAAQITATALIESGRTNELVFALAPAPATLVLTCNAPEAISEIENRKSKIENPLSVVSLQPLTITVSAPDHRPQTLTLGPFDPLSTHEKAVTLEREAGALRIVATVEGVAPELVAPYLEQARIRLDAGEWRAAPLPHTEENMPCREHEVFLDVEGFTAVAPSRRVTVRDAETVEAAFTLTPDPARLTVVCPAAGAEVYDADGQRLGAAGEAFSLASLQSLALSIRAPGYIEGALRLRAMDPGKAYRHEVTLEAEPPPAVPAPEPAAVTGRPGETHTVDLGGGVRLDLAWVAPGSYMRGSTKAEQGAAVAAGLSRDWANRENPQHRVTITTGFWMGKYEVTQEQWQQIMGNNPSRFKGAKNPVELVSWNDCQEFITKLNQRVSGGGFRLPTEAEWEYACRAGTTTAFHYGNDLDSSMANFDGNYPYGSGRKGQYRQTTVPVGSFQPNAWGLYDMHGNVWEWCQDWFGTYPSGAVTDPTGPSSGSVRVLRGGSWRLNAGLCRSANRIRNPPTIRLDRIGLRVVVAR
jgi:formylglycine-generating enzyme